LRVALLSHEGGGISSVCYGLAHSLSKKKIDTTIFTNVTSGKPKTEKIGDYLEIVYLPLIGCPPRILWYYLQNQRTLQRLLGDYNIVHAISPETVLSYTFMNQLKRPLITTLHGSHRMALKTFIQSPTRNWALSDFGFHLLEFPLHDTTTRRCIAKSRRVVVCSVTTQNELKTYENVDSSKVTVIHNGVDLSEIQHEEAELIFEKEKAGDYELSIMYAGRLFWMKGIMYVLRAYENLQKQFKNLGLKIFGKGPLESEIKKFIARRRLNNIYFGGFLPHRELIREIKKSDVIVFPSLYESQPMFALETMACRKPLVAFDLPYAREIVRNGHNGLLARTCDVNDLSKKIASVLSDSNLGQKLGENAFKYVEKNHNWDVQSEKYLRVYQDAMTS